MNEPSFSRREDPLYKESPITVWFQVNHVLPLVCSACGWKERGQRPPQWRAWTVIRRSGGWAAAAGRTGLAASTACFDCLVLCSAFQGTQLQGWVPDSLPYPITSLLLRPGQVEVASWSSPRAPVGGAQRGRGA